MVNKWLEFHGKICVYWKPPYFFYKMKYSVVIGWDAPKFLANCINMVKHFYTSWSAMCFILYTTMCCVHDSSTFHHIGMLSAWFKLVLYLDVLCTWLMYIHTSWYVHCFVHTDVLCACFKHFSTLCCLGAWLALLYTLVCFVYTLNTSIRKPWRDIFTYYLLLTTYYLSLITYYLLLTTYHLLLTTYYLSYHLSPL